jgi:hypothetical protein
LHLWRGRSSAIERIGDPASDYRTPIPLAAPLCRAPDWIYPQRMPRSHRRDQRRIALRFDLKEKADITVDREIDQPEYDESAADDIEMITYPECGKSFPR